MCPDDLFLCRNAVGMEVSPCEMASGLLAQQFDGLAPTHRSLHQDRSIDSGHTAWARLMFRSTAPLGSAVSGSIISRACFRRGSSPPSAPPRYPLTRRVNRWCLNRLVV